MRRNLRTLEALLTGSRETVSPRPPCPTVDRTINHPPAIPAAAAATASPFRCHARERLAALPSFRLIHKMWLGRVSCNLIDTSSFVSGFQLVNKMTWYQRVRLTVAANSVFKNVLSTCHLHPIGPPELFPLCASSRCQMHNLTWKHDHLFLPY
jgi:hypothetical protein